MSKPCNAGIGIDIANSARDGGRTKYTTESAHFNHTHISCLFEHFGTEGYLTINIQLNRGRFILIATEAIWPTIRHLYPTRLITIPRHTVSLKYLLRHSHIR